MLFEGPVDYDVVYPSQGVDSCAFEGPVDYDVVLALYWMFRLANYMHFPINMPGMHYNQVEAE